MKRIGNLWEKVISLDNLRLADEHARKGKTGTYGVRVHDRNREANLLRLHGLLLTKAYRTSPYTVFTVHEPKERVIYRLPYYPDRIVHHAIMNVLEPIWVRTFTHNTFSCIKGRGIEGCARHVERMIRSFDGKPLYCLKIDIRKFYPSVKHGVLKRIVRRKIKDKDLLWLIDEIIDSTDGLPIGNHLSQYLANLMLCYLMHMVNERLGLPCAEYADDIIFLSESKETLHRAFTEAIRPYIEKELELEVKDNWQVFPIAASRYDSSGRALDYVGYKFFRGQKLLRRGIKRNLCRAVGRLNRKTPMPAGKELREGVAPWLGWARSSDSRHLMRTILTREQYESVL